MRAMAIFFPWGGECLPCVKHGVRDAARCICFVSVQYLFLVVDLLCALEGRCVVSITAVVSCLRCLSLSTYLDSE